MFLLFSLFFPYPSTNALIQLNDIALYSLNMARNFLQISPVFTHAILIVWNPKSSPTKPYQSIKIQMNLYLLYKSDLIPMSSLLYYTYNETHALFQIVTIFYLVLCLYLYLLHATL